MSEHLHYYKIMFAARLDSTCCKNCLLILITYLTGFNPSLTHLIFRSTLTHLGGSHPEQFLNDCHSDMKNPIVRKKNRDQFHGL